MNRHLDVMKIKEAEFAKSSWRLDGKPSGGLPEFAFIGRSNVGKSSLINALTGRGRLAQTSSTPGKTRLINHYLINRKWYLVDLPGYGFASGSQKQREDLRRIIMDYIEGSSELVNLFVLVDCRHEPQKIDLAFIEALGQRGIPFSLVFTKADKLGSGRLASNVKTYLDILSRQWEELPPYFVTSSQTGMGREEILDYISSILNPNNKQNNDTRAQA